MQPPRVVRIRRRNGQVVQNCDVYIGRQCFMGGWRLPQSKWFNPFTVKKSNSIEDAVHLYEVYLRDSPMLLSELKTLDGKTIGCWCKNNESDICHGDVIVKLFLELCCIKNDKTL
jgi:hypothetical protein